MRTLLTELGLQDWLKTIGSNGLHVVVPPVLRLVAPAHAVVLGLSLFETDRFEKSCVSLPAIA